MQSDFFQTVPTDITNFVNNATSNIGKYRTTETNPLHDFEPYNYIITLSCISSDTYNSGNFENDRGTIIARTGGKGDTGGRPLDVDYYIERLGFRTIIQSTTESPSTNAFGITMNVQEPFGTDLISALVQASKNQGYNNHMNAVYLLGIRFQGNDDEGVPRNIPIGGERFIPCRFYRVDLDVDAGGGAYTIEAAPQSYVPKNAAYDRLIQQVVCKGDTVQEILESFFNNYNNLDIFNLRKGINNIFYY